MSARSNHLARALLAKMRNLEIAFLDEAAPDVAAVAACRQEVVTQVLQTGDGKVDHASTQLILSAMPPVAVDYEPMEREVAEFAAFLDGLRTVSN